MVQFQQEGYQSRVTKFVFQQGRCSYHAVHEQDLKGFFAKVPGDFCEKFRKLGICAKTEVFTTGPISAP